MAESHSGGFGVYVQCEYLQVVIFIVILDLTVLCIGIEEIGSIEGKGSGTECLIFVAIRREFLSYHQCRYHNNHPPTSLLLTKLSLTRLSLTRLSLTSLLQTRLLQTLQSEQESP